MVDKGVRHVPVGAYPDPLYLVGSDVVGMDQVEHYAHTRMSERAGWVGLDRDAGMVEGPRPAELAIDGGRIETAAGGVEEAALGLEDVGGSRPPEGGELGGHHSALGGASGVEWLGHRAEVLAQAGGLAGGDPEGSRRRFRIEPEESGGCCPSPDRSHGRGAMKAVLVVPRV